MDSWMDGFTVIGLHCGAAAPQQEGLGVQSTSVLGLKSACWVHVPFSTDCEFVCLCDPVVD